jgi:hypothetical protein
VGEYFEVLSQTIFRGARVRILKNLGQNVWLLIGIEPDTLKMKITNFITESRHLVASEGLKRKIMQATFRRTSITVEDCLSKSLNTGSIQTVELF